MCVTLTFPNPRAQIGTHTARELRAAALVRVADEEDAKPRLHVPFPLGVHHVHEGWVDQKREKEREMGTPRHA